MAPTGDTQIQYGIKWLEEVDMTWETRLTFEHDWTVDFSRGMSRESVVAAFDVLDERALELALSKNQKRKRKHCQKSHDIT